MTLKIAKTYYKYIMNFKEWLLTEELHTLDTHMSVPEELEEITRIMKSNNKICYVVGGAVRDHLFNMFHDMKKDINDYDLATNALPEETRKILHNKNIGDLKLEIFDKGVDQGVLSIIVKDKNDKKINEFEIATFRKEVYSGTSRKPERTEFGASPEEDTKRRDLNYNALFYDPLHKQVKDFNSGKGIEDIKKKKTSVVGDPYQRFYEDKLRVLRVVRFFNRYNDDNILDHMDEQTKNAIKEFKNLENVSKERINKEFLSGLKQSKSPANFVKSLNDLDLIHNIMPSNIKPSKIDGLDFMNHDIPSMMAYLLKDEEPNKNLSDSLVKYKFDYDVLTPTFIILKTYHMLKNPDNKDYRIHDVSRDMKRISLKSILPFMRHFGLDDLATKLYEYKPKFSGSDVMNLGLKGKEISNKLDQIEKNNFFNRTINNNE